jgi:hypothetical protein
VAPYRAKSPGPLSPEMGWPHFERNQWPRSGETGWPPIPEIGGLLSRES